MSARAFVRPAFARILAEAAAATVTSSLALAFVARWSGRRALQPINATSHWLNGDAAAAETGAGWRTTGVGFVTHAAAIVFWSAIYEGWLRRDRTSVKSVVGKAAAMAAVSALVDYRFTPKRFTPGWELVLGPGAMAGVYLALAAGLATGARWTET